MTDPTPWSKAGALVSIASMFVGTTEEGGDNKGAFVERFQKAVDDKAQGEPWCLAFVWFAIDAVQSLWLEANLPGAADQPKLTRTEHCLTMWNGAPEEQKLAFPERGCLVVWQHYDKGKPTTRGHVGICIQHEPETIDMKTIEGNTGPGTTVEREGDGVYIKRRLLVGGGPSMRIVGYLRVW